MKTIVKRKGHQHAYDVVDRIEVDKLVGRTITRRIIRIRQCACGEVGYEVPA